MEDTILKINVIIDNQVQIGHNCIIAITLVFAALQALLVAVISALSLLSVVVGINGHISICDNVQVTGYTMIVQDITEPGVYSSASQHKPTVTGAKIRRLQNW